ncbi:hypothetical protein H257_07781 [Aphanomyces astaci]|uniref:Uncharacterized protein n=1 Tax=Aphanomyces astaci TaxID=112090 RepID=W4GJ92_APHAT|nr:hypothetical protein H257_07781 [Aphanomyces astaci]ETV78993.1 hypothetical protein H257_07781 [Aphanomyces astaci]|eukprot:XP_009831712.1 hypothetical protein H257_07781 [Aphanomyces astaci]
MAAMVMRMVPGNNLGPAKHHLVVMYPRGGATEMGDKREAVRRAVRPVQRTRVLAEASKGFVHGIDAKRRNCRCQRVKQVVVDAVVLGVAGKERWKKELEEFAQERYIAYLHERVQHGQQRGFRGFVVCLLVPPTGRRPCPWLGVLVRMLAEHLDQAAGHVGCGRVPQQQDVRSRRRTVNGRCRRQGRRRSRAGSVRRLVCWTFQRISQRVYAFGQAQQL